MRKAMIVSGGWEGHSPNEFADIYTTQLSGDFVVTNSQDLTVYEDAGALLDYDLIVPNWTMGKMSANQARNLSRAVKKGVGLAGVHGGMGDSARGNLTFEWMVGGHFLDHPHVGEYEIQLTDHASEITEGIDRRFRYNSEQYYVMVDPAVRVLAETVYRYDDQEIVMPVCWTKTWGAGRVFYCSLGHAPGEFTAFPNARTLAIRGMQWAARTSKAGP